jgi:hypothetical protein
MTCGVGAKGDMSPPLSAEATDSADDERVYSTIDSLPVVQDEFEAGAESVECVDGVGGGDAHVGLAPSH